MASARIRLASYNLQKCVGLDLRRTPARSLGVIESIGADIMVLQEADKRLPPRPAALPKGMAEAAGWRVLPFGASGSLGWHGNAMLLRPGLTVHETSEMTLPGLEPRGAVRADLDTPIGPVRVVGVHLGLMRRHRLQQVEAILRHLAPLPTRPTVLAGDFNEWGAPLALDQAMGGLDFVSTPASFPAPRPVAQLDRIAISPELRARATGRITQAPARIASDHLPVWADLERLA